MIFNHLYRLFFCRGGYGVHSPFVFDLITNIIEETRPYYCYDYLHYLRKQLKRENCCFQLKEKEHKLLLRLSNLFLPQKTLSVGSDYGLTPLYLTAFSKTSSCHVIESEKHKQEIAIKTVQNYTEAKIEFIDHSSTTLFQSDYDMIYCDLSYNTFSLDDITQNVNESGVIVLNGIKTNPEIWHLLISNQRVTTIIDLYNLVIVFFNPNLPRKRYKCVLP